MTVAEHPSAEVAVLPANVLVVAGKVLACPWDVDQSVDGSGEGCWQLVHLGVNSWSFAGLL